MLVPIRAAAASALPPLFLIHPVGGSVMAYFDLARSLRPQQPVYAIENQVVFNPDALLCRTIEEMAERYHDEIRTVRPKGPYLVGGYSMGGLVAFEIARQLRAQGQEVLLVAIIDTPARIVGPADPSDDMGEVSARDLVTMATLVAGRVDKQVHVTVEELERLPSADERIARLIEILRAQRIVPSQVDVSLFRQLLAVVRNNDQAQRRYVARTSAGGVHLIRAMEMSPHFEAEVGDLYLDPTLGWQAVCREPVVVSHVPGSHLRVMSQPYVRAVGVSLQRRIDHKLAERYRSRY